MVGCPEEDLAPYLNQGACNTSYDCVKGYHCEQAACIKDGEDAGVEADPCGCLPPQSCCNSVCVDLKTDPVNCKTCGAACKNTQCNNGECTELCVPGFLNCNGNLISDGCEVEAASCPEDGG